MNCSQCGGGLLARSDICQFCGTRNDSDLRRFDVLPGEPSTRVCPHCREAMTTITVHTGGKVNLERCGTCFGIFFDRYELEDLLTRTSANPHYDVDFKRLETLLGEGRRLPTPVRYVACPVCGELMHRRAFGFKSGVVIDTCKEHGAWLDGGELGELIRWAKLGGMNASPSSVELPWTSEAEAEAEAAAMDEEAGTDSAERAARRVRRKAPLEALSRVDPSRSRGHAEPHWLIDFFGQLVGAIADAIVH